MADVHFRCASQGEMCRLTFETDGKELEIDLSRPELKHVVGELLGVLGKQVSPPEEPPLLTVRHPDRTEVGIDQHGDAALVLQASGLPPFAFSFNDHVAVTLAESLGKIIRMPRDVRALRDVH